MAYAKLSGSLLARNDAGSLVSVPAAATADKSLSPSPIIEEPEGREAIELGSVIISEPRLGSPSRGNTAKLIGLVLCAAAIGACGFLIENHLEAHRAIHTRYVRADDNAPNLIQPATVAVPTPLDSPQPVTAASTSEQSLATPSLLKTASVPDIAITLGEASPKPPDSAPSAISISAPESEHGYDPSINVAALMERGDMFFTAGDVASARLFYQRAANTDDGTAALRLGESFDPAFLQRAHLVRVPGDQQKAMYWYLRASELGNDDAKVLLKSMGYTDKK
jgi:hypothetical protein